MYETQTFCHYSIICYIYQWINVNKHKITSDHTLIKGFSVSKGLCFKNLKVSS